MPRKRDPLKRLTVDEMWHVATLEYDIRAMWRKLGGTVCNCGTMVTNDKASPTHNVGCTRERGA